MQLGVIGLGTMGAALARNAARNGVEVAVFNRTREKTDAFAAAHGGEGRFVPCGSLSELVSALSPPRAILLMVNAGEAVDAMLRELASSGPRGGLSEAGDTLIDGGNSHFRDTARREGELAGAGIRFLGLGVSGGAEGALRGPSLMAGGSREAFDSLSPMLAAMAAEDGDGGKCSAYLGPGGAGHFVKMVHNGIEYAVMQLLAECYDILRSLGGLSNARLATMFAEWNADPELSSFLLEITAKIFAMKDPETGADLLDIARDRVGQKGTGKWTIEAALDLGVPVPTITAATDARMLSSEEKRSFRDRAKFPEEPLRGVRPPTEELERQARAAYECSVLSVYNQGFHLIEWASKAFRWEVPMAEVARIWRGGCIIRAALLQKFQRACSGDRAVSASAVEEEIIGRFSGGRQREWRSLVAAAASSGVPVPALAASLSYYDAIRRERLPQNLTALQREFFGAHGFERSDRPGVFHL